MGKTTLPMTYMAISKLPLLGNDGHLSVILAASFLLQHKSSRYALLCSSLPMIPTLKASL